MNLKIVLVPISLAATSFILASCAPTPYHNGKEIRVISRRCDTSGCLDKVQYAEGDLPAFEIAPDRIEWR
jgi:predicted small secreted protein